MLFVKNKHMISRKIGLNFCNACYVRQFDKNCSYTFIILIMIRVMIVIISMINLMIFS